MKKMDLNQPEKKRAVFLDRDDTIIYNVPYLGDPSQVRLIEGSAKALQLLKHAGFTLILVSNQSGVGRGFITLEQVRAVNQEMFHQLGSPFFQGVYNSYASPENDPDNLRKPSPKLLFQAAEEHNISLEESFFVGDRWSDIACGQRANCKSILVLTASHPPQEIKKASAIADFVAKDILSATEWILSSTPSFKNPINTNNNGY